MCMCGGGPAAGVLLAVRQISVNQHLGRNIQGLRRSIYAGRTASCAIKQGSPKTFREGKVLPEPVGSL
jgi:hypothetical protein